MSFAEKLKKLTLTIIGFTASFALLWYGVSTTKRQFLLPTMIRESLPIAQTGQKQQIALSVDKVTPYPNETNISTYPNIMAVTSAPVGQYTEVSISPKVNFKKTITSDRKHILIKIDKPLKPLTTYTISIDDPQVQAHYSWAFRTGATVIDQELIASIDRVKEQMPYRDPNNNFYIFYAAQTDMYFVTIHNDERSVKEQELTINWLRSQGIANEKILQITWIPSDAF